MTLLASLVTRLSLESSSFSTGMSRARRQAQTDTASIAKSVDGVNKKLNAFGQALTLAAIGATAKRALEYASSLNEVSQQLGVTAKDLQTYRYAASQVGIEQDAMDKGLKKLTLSMSQAQAGAKAPTAAFKALGISVADLKGATAGDLLPKIADGLQKMGGAAKGAAAGAAVMGKNFMEFAPLLNMGSKGIEGLTRAAEDLGLVLSNKQIQDADALADKLSELKQVLEARIAGVVADNAASILSLANALGNLTARVIQFMAANPAKASALIAGLAAGAITKSPIVAAGAALLAGGLANQESVASLRSSVAGRKRFVTEQYLRRGGTQAEIASGKLNQKVLSDPHMQTYLAEYGQLRGRLKDAMGGAVAASAPPPAMPDGNIPQFLGGGGHKRGGGGPSAEQRAKEALRVQYDLDKEEIEGKRDLIQAQLDINNTVSERADGQRQLADLELQSKQRSIKFDLDTMLVDKTISDKQKEEAKLRADKALALAGQLHDIDIQKINNDVEVARQRAEAAVEDDRFDARKEALQAEEQMATTASERRKIELELLDIAYEQKRVALHHILNDRLPNGSPTHSEEERAAADREMARLGASYGSARSGVLQGTRGPLESFMASIPKTAAEMNEALEGVAAEGLASLRDGLAQASASWIKMGGIAGDVLRQVYSSLMKLVLGKGISALLGAFGGGGLKGAVHGMIAAHPDAFATGGSMIIGGMAGIDRNMLSLNGAPIARVSRGESLNIAQANDNGGSGGRPVVFDLRGAVMTEDLLRQMQAMADGSGVRAVAASVATVGRNLKRSGRRAIR